MTPEEIQQLISSTLKAELEGALSVHLEKLKPAAQEQPKEDPLNSRLAKLEKQLKEATEREKARELEAQQLRFSNTLGSALAGKGNILHQKIVAELLENRYKSGAIERDGEWYTKDGSKLSEAVESFFSSDEGLHFLPSNHQNGTQTPTNKQPATNSTDKADLDTMISQMVF
jgi:hypothetical protein